MKPQVKGFLDPLTMTISYVLTDGTHAAIIDPVLDYDAASGQTFTKSADKLVEYVREHALQLDWILETHAHADHLSAARYVKGKLGGRIAIGENILKVQGVFKKLYNLQAEFQANGNQFDYLVKDGEVLKLGQLELKAMLVPGHTPACLSYQVGDVVFVGDTLFMPDIGTARADFPGGSAHDLYKSIKRILSLPEATRLMHCHDYPPAGREPKWESTVAEQRAHNIHVRDGIGADEFVAMREERDATLAAPRLLLPSLQVNIRAGDLPAPEDNGTAYLKIPLNVLKFQPEQ